MNRREWITLCGAGLLCARNETLESQWRRIAADTDGEVGAAALHSRAGWRASLNGGDRFPLASVCKLPIAMRILALVDQGMLKRDQNVEVLAQDVLPWASEVAKKWPRQREWKLDELLEAMVAESDNTAVEALFRVGGRAAGMAASFHEWKITGVRVDRSEGECMLASLGVQDAPPVKQWTPAYWKPLLERKESEAGVASLRKFVADAERSGRDTGTPDGTVQLLERAFLGKLLSSESTARLKQILEATSTGKARLRGLLPRGTVVAHKTGTADTVGGYNGATNDVGVISLPTGDLVVAVYIKGSTRDLASREHVIARIAKAAYDHAA